MATNPYANFLEKYFKRILELRHNTSRITSLLTRSVDALSTVSKAKNLSVSSLVIRDWTTKDRMTSALLHTGVSQITRKSKYRQEVNRLISLECCHAVAQSFEALESYVKDSVYYKYSNDPVFRKKIRLRRIGAIKRNNLPGGDNLYELLKLACGKEISAASKNNIYNIRFKEMWTVLSDARHGIIHSSSRIRRPSLRWSAYHHDLFSFLFDYDESKTYYDRTLDYSKTDLLLRRFAEFGFQLHKCLSMSEGKEWEWNLD